MTIEDPMTSYTQSFEIFIILFIVFGNIGPIIFPGFVSHPAFRTKFRLTKLSTYPGMETMISDIISFPIRIFISLLDIFHFNFKFLRMFFSFHPEMWGAFSRTILSFSNFYPTRKCFEYFIASKAFLSKSTREVIKTFQRTIFSFSPFHTIRLYSKLLSTLQTVSDYRHACLQIKRLCSACFEVTVRLLTHTKSHILNIKNPLPQSLFIICFLFILSTISYAEPYFCSAPWPPPAGSDSTRGKDSDGSVCIKISKPVEKVVEVPALPCVAAPGLATWRVEFAKADYIYHTDIEADIVETVGTFLVFKKGEIEVARFSAKYVLGYILIQP